MSDVAESPSISRDIAGGLGVGLSHRHPDREPNEDAMTVIFVDDRRGVLAVADGLGGHAAGHRASATVVAALEEALEGPRPGEIDVRSTILTAIETAATAILESGSGGGATVAIVEIERDWVRPYHVGDAGILVFGQRGRVRYRSVSHSPVGYAFESGMLDEKEAMEHADRHVISNAVGFPDMRIEIGPTIALRRRDTVLIATDGLFDNMFIEEIVEAARCGPLEAAVHRLLAIARDRMLHAAGGAPSKPDDLTAVLYRPVDSGRRHRENGS